MANTPRKKTTTRKKAARRGGTSVNEARLAANIASSLLTRRNLAGFLGQTFNGARDLYSVLGYKQELKFRDYEAAYDRGDIAARIIDAFPESTWRRKPHVQDDADPDTITPFEKAWETLEKQLRIFHFLERVDKLAGIGDYGVLLLGTADLRNRDDLKKPMAASIRAGGLGYLNPYTSDSAQVEELDVDPSSPNYGRPLLYRVRVMSASGQLNETEDILVHYSRVLHIAEGLREDEIYGTPRLKKCFNRLQDIEKVAGGSAEIFWQAAKRIMVMSAKEDFTAVDDDDTMTAQMEELVHGLRRVIDVQGYDVKTLDPTQVQPTQTFDTSIALISAATGIPQRILLGSEQGKLASEQDEGNWNGRVSERQINFAEPVILRPLVDRLILTGILPEPDGGDYNIVWPTLFEVSEKEKATVGLVLARSLAAYVGKGGENLESSMAIITPDEFREKILNIRGSAPVSEAELQKLIDDMKSAAQPAPGPGNQPQPDASAAGGQQ